MPRSRVTLIDCARITRLSDDSGRPAADDEFVTSSARARGAQAQAVEHGLEIQHPARERIARGIFRTVRARVTARLPQYEPVARGERGDVDVPEIGVPPDPIREDERRPRRVGIGRTMLFVVEANAVVGADVRHWTRWYARTSANGR